MKSINEKGNKTVTIATFLLFLVGISINKKSFLSISYLILMQLRKLFILLKQQNNFHILTFTLFIVKNVIIKVFSE